MENLKTYFEQSMKENKGLTLYINGNQIVGVVTGFDTQNVELKSREFSKILVDLSAIKAIAIS